MRVALGGGSVLVRYVESPNGGDDAAYDNDVAMETDEDSLDAMDSESDDDGDDEGSD